MTALILTIKNTETFKNSSSSLQNHLVADCNIGIIKRALEMKEAGYSFDDWSNTTSAGKAYKSIVKELY
jgi:hypothetical protein